MDGLKIEVMKMISATPIIMIVTEFVMDLPRRRPIILMLIVMVSGMV